MGKQISEELRERVRHYNREIPAVRHRHFKVTDGPLMDEMQRIMDHRQKAFKAAGELSEELKAKSASYAGDWIFAFDKGQQQSDDFQKLWRKVGRWEGKTFFKPRRNTKAGRQMAARLKKLPRILDHNQAVKVVGLDTGPAVIEGNTWYRPVIWGWGADDPLFFVKVPWRDFDPEILEAYRIMRDADEFMCTYLDYAMWEPHPSMHEIPEWQVLKITDERNKGDAA